MTVSDAETSGGGGAQGGVIAEQNRKISPSAPNGASPFSDPTHVHSPCIEASRVNSTLGDVNLSLDEQASLRLFLSHVNSWRGARGYPSLSETAATKFLMARKFQVFKIIEQTTYLNFRFTSSKTLKETNDKMWYFFLRWTGHYHYIGNMR